MANKTRETANLVSSKTGIAVTISGDPVILGVGNTQHLRVTGGGQIGVGKNPGKILDLQASEGLAIRYYDDTSTFRAGLEVATSPSDMVGTSGTHDFCIRSQSNMLFSAGGNTERLRIDSTGKISQGGHTASYEYDLRGTGQQTILVGSENAGGAALILDGDSDGDGSGTDYASILHSSDGNIEINNRKSADIIFKNTSSETERLRITSAGELLVGRITKANDQNTLVVSGPSPADVFDNQLYLEGNETTGAVDTGGAITFGGHDGVIARNWANIYGMKENGTSDDQASYMSFHTRPTGGGPPTEKVRISSTGSVGIGTTDPEGSLHITTGNSGDCVLILEADEDNNLEHDNAYIEFRQDGGIPASAIGMNMYNSNSENNSLILSNSLTPHAGIIFKTGTGIGHTLAEERLRITPGGDVQVTTGNLVFSTAGAGIDFSAASGSASGSSSALLDDYEEGSWTPDLRFDSSNTGVTYASSGASKYGTYTRVGSLVFCRFMFQLSNKGSASGNAQIHGLPFTVYGRLGGTSIEGEGGITYFDNKGSQSGLPYMLPWQDTTYARMYAMFEAANTDSSSVGEDMFENGSSVRGFFWYYAS
tara:strand:+ start:1414 stop:3198 length:1785 start_codon:yes stop_codon:yes gene_type:complete